MPVDRELLWKAWPLGFMPPVCGMRTVGGLCCCAVEPEPPGAAIAGAVQTRWFQYRSPVGPVRVRRVDPETGVPPLALAPEPPPDQEDFEESVYGLRLSKTGQLFGIQAGLAVILGRGDLLPNVDPEGDPATWACVKRDLALALGWDVDALELRWTREGRGSCSNYALSAQSRLITTALTDHVNHIKLYKEWDIPEGMDAATALVVVRARLQEAAVAD